MNNCCFSFLWRWKRDNLERSLKIFLYFSSWIKTKGWDIELLNRIRWKNQQLILTSDQNAPILSILLLPGVIFFSSFVVEFNMVGFCVGNRDSIASFYTCGQCDLLLRSPRQSPCGHRLCQSCIDSHDGYIFVNRWTRKECSPCSGFRTIFPCPSCGESVEKKKVNSIESFILYITFSLQLVSHRSRYHPRHEIVANHMLLVQLEWSIWKLWRETHCIVRFPSSCHENCSILTF